MPTEPDPYLLYALAVKLSWRLATEFNLDLTEVESICRDHVTEYVDASIYDELVSHFGSVVDFDVNLWQTAVSNRLIKEALDDDGLLGSPVQA